jgi:DNA-directed RNA polymerase subunit E'/Rpb7
MLLQTVISIHPNQLNTMIEQNILNLLKNEFEDKVISEGHIKKNSIILKSYGDLRTEVDKFQGHVRCLVHYSASICNPTENDIIQCQIAEFNSFAILAVAGPLTIIIQDDSISNQSYKIGQILTVKVINTQLLIKNNQIHVVASLVNTNQTGGLNPHSKNRLFDTEQNTQHIKENENETENETENDDEDDEDDDDEDDEDDDDEDDEDEEDDESSEADKSDNAEENEEEQEDDQDKPDDKQELEENQISGDASDSESESVSEDESDIDDSDMD